MGVCVHVVPYVITKVHVELGKWYLSVCVTAADRNMCHFVEWDVAQLVEHSAVKV